MTSRDFCYWLQGFFEIADPKSMTTEQVEMVKRHLNMVFFHEIDPTFGDERQQQILDEIHKNKDPLKDPLTAEEAEAVRKDMREKLKKLKLHNQQPYNWGPHGDKLIRC